MTYYMLLITILVSSQLNAWGRLGHQITAKIAETHLSEPAKEQIRSVLGNNDLVSISDWADRIRPTKRYLKWHYTTINKKNQLVENKNNGLLYYGLKNSIAIYRDKKQSKNKRKEALKLIVHLVGDAHQPLHVGNGRDAGGNLCGVKWFKRKKLVSLHKIWDVFLVKAMYAKNPWIVADAISIEPDDTEIKTWLNESRSLHKKIYPKFCAFKWGKDRAVHLGQNYVDKHIDLVRQRLIQGGIRLASILNKIAM